MSKIDELRETYSTAYQTKLDSYDYDEAALNCIAEAERAGIAAVVRALRDELEYHRKYRIGAQPWLLIARLDEILGDAGDEVAHICDGDEGPSLHQTPATDPASVNVAKMQRTLLRKWRKAAQKRTEAQR